MRLVFASDATEAQRAAVAEALRGLGTEFVASRDALVSDVAPDDDDALALAAMPGVAAIEPTPASKTTVKDAVLVWAAGASAVIGVATIVAANLPATIGAPADPLRTPSPLRPSWPLLPWYAAVDQAPSWLPVPLLFVLAALLLFFWPDVARPLATKRPVAHALIGIAALLVVAGLVALEAGR